MDKKLTISLLLDFYGQVLSEKQFQIMDYYYNDDLSLREISEILGITRQGVHDTIKRSEAFLEELEQSLGLYAKWQRLQQQLESIEGAVKEITGENDRLCKNEAIKNNCLVIEQAIDDMKNNF